LLLFIFISRDSSFFSSGLFSSGGNGSCHNFYFYLSTLESQEERGTCGIKLYWFPCTSFPVAGQVICVQKTRLFNKQKYRLNKYKIK
jgi:hypothetical protein